MALMDGIKADFRAALRVCGVCRRYIPGSATGVIDGSTRTERTILVNESSGQVQSVQGIPESIAPRATVQVLNDPVEGIWSQELNIGADQIEVLLDGVVQARPIGRIIEADEASLLLEVR